LEIIVLTDCTYDELDERGETFDAINAVEQIIKDGFNTSSLWESEKALPKAPNCIEFCGPEFLGGIVPYGKQAEILLRTFEDYCPKCSDKSWVDWVGGGIPVDAEITDIRKHVTILHHGTCPECGKNRIELSGQFPYEVNGCAGMRSGKTAVTGGIIAPYALHRYLKLDQPAMHFRQLPGTTLHMTFFAVAAHQAADTLWDAFVKRMEYSPWFCRYYEEVNKENPGSVDWKTTYHAYYHKGITAWYTGSGSVKRAGRGRTRIFAAADELGWWNQSPLAEASADEVYGAIEVSLSTIREEAQLRIGGGDFDVPMPLMVNIGSPSDIFDKLMRLLASSEGDTRRVTFHWATWEMNPRMPKTSPFLADKMKKNYQDFMRDYGAAPIVSGHKFLSSSEREIVISSIGKKAPQFKVEHIVYKDKIGDEYVSARLVACRKDTKRRILALDAGELLCSFAGTLYSWDTSKNRIDLDGAFEIPPLDGLPVHFPDVLNNLIVPLVQEANVMFVAFDRWNSTYPYQALKDKGIMAETYNPISADYKALKGVIAAARIGFAQLDVELVQVQNEDKAFEQAYSFMTTLFNLPVEHPEVIRAHPIAHLLRQLMTVSNIGRKIVSVEGRDDLFRTLVLGVAYVLEHQKELATDIGNRATTTAVGVLRRGGMSTYNKNRTSGESKIGLVKFGRGYE